MFKGLKAQDINFNDYFFNSSTTFRSSGNFINEKNIIIYDKNKKISEKELQYEYEQDKVLKKINIVHNLPKIKNYLLLSDYIINDNLSVISFANSEKKKYII